MKLKQAEQLLKTLHLELSGEDIKLKQTNQGLLILTLVHEPPVQELSNGGRIVTNMQGCSENNMRIVLQCLMNPVHTNVKVTDVADAMGITLLDNARAVAVLIPN